MLVHHYGCCIPSTSQLSDGAVHQQPKQGTALEVGPCPEPVRTAGCGQSTGTAFFPYPCALAVLPISGHRCLREPTAGCKGGKRSKETLPFGQHTWKEALCSRFSDDSVLKKHFQIAFCEWLEDDGGHNSVEAPIWGPGPVHSRIRCQGQWAAVEPALLACCETYLIAQVKSLQEML